MHRPKDFLLNELGPKNRTFGGTRRAEASCFAAQGKQFLGAAFLASEAGETSQVSATLKILADDLIDHPPPPAVLFLKTSLINSLEVVIMVINNGIKGGFFGMAWSVCLVCRPGAHLRHDEMAENSDFTPKRPQPQVVENKKMEPDPSSDLM